MVDEYYKRYILRFEESIKDTEFYLYWLCFKDDCLLRNLLMTSIKGYAEGINHFIRYCIENNVSFENVDRPLLKRYILSFASNVSPATVNGRVKSLRRFFNCLIDDDLWSKENPLNKIPIVKGSKKIKNILLPEDIKNLLKACPNTYEGNRNKLIINILWDCMIRKTELLNLTLKDVNMPGRFLDIMGKGRKQRYVPLSPQLMKLIYKHRTKYDKYIRNHLICSRDGEPIKSRHCLTILKRLGDKAGIEYINVHLIRHSAITWMLNNTDVDPVHLMLIVGHEDFKTTQGYYHPNKTDIINLKNYRSPMSALK